MKVEPMNWRYKLSLIFYGGWTLLPRVSERWWERRNDESDIKRD